MARLILTLLGLLSFASVAVADPLSLGFGGERFVRVGIKTSPDGQRIAQLLRERETPNAWTKLVTVRSYPSATNPSTLTGGMIKAVKKRDPQARFKLLENPTTKEVMLDYLTFGVDGEMVEFNLVKLSKQVSGPGVVAFHFVQRFPLGEVSGPDIARVREAAVKEAATFDSKGLGSILAN